MPGPLLVKGRRTTTLPASMRATAVPPSKGPGSEIPTVWRFVPNPDSGQLLGRRDHSIATQQAAGVIPLLQRGEACVEARLSQDANFPATQIVERLDEVLRAAAPSAELGRQDGHLSQLNSSRLRL